MCVCVCSGTEMPWITLIASQIQLLDKTSKVILAELPAKCKITPRAA